MLTAKPVSERRADGLWAITSFFNPLGYRRRLENYKIFRANLNVPLLAVELAYGPEFELHQGDADILLQIRGHDVLWQKERLLNAGLRALPPDCRRVMWIDCDVMFESDGWEEEVHRLLDRHLLLQLFNRVRHLPPEWKPGMPLNGGTEVGQPSVISGIAAGVPAAACLGQALERKQDSYSRGFAWAAHRELVDRHGFYDSCIVGGGDTALACAAHGCMDEVIRLHLMNERQKEKYLAWAEPYYARVRAETGFLDRTILHLWHGRMADRRASQRHEELRRYQFNPFEDIATAENGSWRWNSPKPDMHEFVRQYFATRNEDA